MTPLMYAAREGEEATVGVMYTTLPVRLWVIGLADGV